MGGLACCPGPESTPLGGMLASGSAHFPLSADPPSRLVGARVYLCTPPPAGVAPSAIVPEDAAERNRAQFA